LGELSLINALSLTTPALARIFSAADHWGRTHVFLGATGQLPVGQGRMLEIDQYFPRAG
jgi:hypothetical protein